ncbi:hypothetical protein [Pseudomonas sp. NPDC089401]|uniref:hypothetical protein n=1 Tax=Pseudomonas sp. NPDC089401 TaxID=3364462 RepID=UPI00381EED8F
MSPLIRAAALGLALTALAGCTSKAVLTPSRPLAADHSYSQAQVQQAILMAVAERGWTARSITAQRIQADITVRNTFYAAVNIDYTPRDYRISYRDSRGMDYADGKIHRNYNRWVKNLSGSILRQLKTYDTQKLLLQQQQSLSQQSSDTLN